MAMYAVALCLVAWLGARYLSRPDAPAGAPPAASRSGPPGDGIAVERQSSGRVTVLVAGEVRRPGVYRLRDGERVEAAVRAAGGATSRGDLDGLNLASKAQDGRQIVVPRRGPVAAPAPSSGGAAGAPPGGGPGQRPPPQNPPRAQRDTQHGRGPAPPPQKQE